MIELIESAFEPETLKDGTPCRVGHYQPVLTRNIRVPMSPMFCGGEFPVAGQHDAYFQYLRVLRAPKFVTVESK